MRLKAIFICVALLIDFATSSTTGQGNEVVQHEAEKMLDRFGASALCTMKVYCDRIVSDTAEYLVEEIGYQLYLIKSDIHSINHYTGEINRYFGDLPQDQQEKVMKACEVALNITKARREIAEAAKKKAEDLVLNATLAANLTLGEIGEDEDGNATVDNTTGLARVINWHCGYSKVENETEPPSTSCHVVGKRKRFSGGFRNTISCQRLEKSVSYKNATAENMRRALMEWNVVKPMPKENGKICQDTDDHTNHSCTVWEGWVADYKKTTDLMKKLGGAERRARRARLQGEVEVIGLYKIYQALRAGEESDVIELLLEEAEEKRMLANEAELVSGVLVTRGSDKMSLERDKDLKLLKQARTETPKGMSWTMVAMISSLPVGLALMVYIISRFRKMPENGKDDLISPTCSCSLTNVGVEGDLVKK